MSSNHSPSGEGPSVFAARTRQVGEPAEPSSVDDRRRAPRYRVAVRVEYALEGERRRANVYDLGAGGVFIRTATPLKPGTSLDLTLLVPGKSEFVCADGQVVWTNLVETDSIPVGMGVHFVRIDPTARHMLLEQLEALP